MSQAKVDKYKQEKYNRKNQVKKSNIKKVLTYVATTVVALALLVYLCWSIAISTGLYTPPTDAVTSSTVAVDVDSLRETLIQNGDTNVATENVETDAATEPATTEAAK